MAEEVPVNLDAPCRTARFTPASSSTTSFTAPKGATPDIRVEAIRRVPAPDGPRLVVRLENTGTKRGWIRRFVLRVVVDGQTFELTEREVPALEDLPVLAGGHREVSLPWPAKLPAAAPSAASIVVRY